MEQIDPLKKDKLTTQRIRFTLTAQELRALISSGRPSQIRTSPKIERINFSIPISKLRVMVFASNKVVKAEKKENRKTVQPNINVQPYTYPVGNLLLSKIGKLLIAYFLLTAIGGILSTDFAWFLIKTYALAAKQMKEVMLIAVSGAIVLFVITTVVYHVVRLFKVHKLRKFIGVISGIVLHLVFVIPVTYIFFLIFESVSNRPKGLAGMEGALVFTAVYAIIAFLYLFGIHIASAFSTFLLQFIGNKEYQFL